MKPYIYDPVLHGQVPPHLQAAVLLAGGKIDKITMSGAQHEGPTALRLTLAPHWTLPAGLIDGKTDGAWTLYVYVHDELFRERHISGEAAVIRLLQVTSST